MRVGDVLDIRPLAGSRGGNAEIAAVIKDYLHDAHGLRLDSAGRVAVETAVDVVDALFGRAFMHSDRGESTVLSEAQRVSVHCSGVRPLSSLQHRNMSSLSVPCSDRHRVAHR